MAHRYFFACYVFTFCQVTGQPIKYALLGQDVQFMTSIQTAPDDILWKRNGNKVVEFNGNVQKQYGSYEGRVTLDWRSADLHITNLRYEDSGHYDLEVYTKNLMKSSQYDLEVIDSVAKPTISCEMNDGDGAGKTGGGAMLMCSAGSEQSQSLMKFDWSSDGKKQVGPQLKIPLGDVHDDQVYNCTVSNPLTKESATFTAKECYPDKSLSTPVVVAISILVPLILILAFGLVVVFKLCKGKGGRETKTDVENQSDQDTAGVLHNDREDKRVLLDRAPTVPSHQSLNHLIQKPTHNDSEKQNQDLRTPLLRPVPEKPPRSQGLSSDEYGKAVEENASVHSPTDSVFGEQLADLEDNRGKRMSFAPPVPEKSELVREASKRLAAKENGVKPSADVETKASDSGPAASAEADVTLPDYNKQSSKEDEIDSPPSSSSGTPPHTHDLLTKEQADEDESRKTGENKDPQPDPTDSKTSDTSLEENRDERKSISPKPEQVKEGFSRLPGKEDGEKLSGPAASAEADVSDKHGPGEEEELATSKDGAQSLKPVAKPRSRSGSKMAPETESKQESSLDQAAGESHKKLPTNNSGEETLEGDKQVPEDKTPDGVADQEQLDPPSNTSKAPQSSTCSEPADSNADTLQSSDAEDFVQDHKDEDKTRQNSEGSPEKGDKSKDES